MTVPWRQWGNDSLVGILERELPQSTIYWLVASIFAATIWIVYLMYYNSRVIGLIVTLIINKFVKQAHVKFGSFSISMLSGKIMFRDVHYVTEDYSLRIQLGYIIFRWWGPMPDPSNHHTDTRLTVFLDSVELHVYNRSSEYARLERLFGLDEFMIPGSSYCKDEDSKGEDAALTGKPKQQSQTADSNLWMELIPVIKFEIASGKLVFGNHLLPTTLSINFGDANILYTTKPASTPFDLFMLIVKCKADHVRALLVPSPKYQGTVHDEPPRYMGDGFVVFQSSAVEIYYYQDEPGIVPYEPEQVQLANGDVIARRTWPCRGMDIRCGRGTDLSYGPWADRQREYLWKFFYPADFQPLEATEWPNPGQRRIVKSFDFKLSIQQEGTFDVLFTKERETQAIHMHYAAGSYLEFSIPMVTEGNGYVSKFNGQLMHLEATTSLSYRPFVEAETFEFDVEACYPKQWNEHQDWKCNLTFCKASGSLIYQHKIFLMGLVEDWSTKTRPDLFHFYPYTWRVGLHLREFELAAIANEWNWIDCFGPTLENTQVAMCGESFDIAFDLSFIDYLPEIVPIKFSLKVETADLRFYLPETNTTRNIMLAIAENMRIVDRNGVATDAPFAGLFSHRWRRRTLKEDGWVDVWTTPNADIKITYTYHPQPPTGEDVYMHVASPITTPEAEEQLLIPLRAETSSRRRPPALVVDFDPGDIASDRIEIEVELGPSTVCVYGGLVMNLYHLKENYLGEDQLFTDLSQSCDDSGSSHHAPLNQPVGGSFDKRTYRPLAVRVNAVFNDIQAHLVKNVNAGEPPVPCARIERAVFELDKEYEGTQLQVLLSPAYLVLTDSFKARTDDKVFNLRPEAHRHVNEGHLALSGLQVRGHAMFSHRGLPLGSETLEYGWLVEVIVGDLTGRLTSSHLQNLVEVLQTALLLVQDSENILQHAKPYHMCQHGVPAPDCNKTPAFLPLCPSSEDIKYRLTRVSVDCVDLYLAEAGTALNVQVYPVRLSTCNLHGKHNEAGITAVIPNIKLRQFVLSIPINQDYNSQTDLWLEAGGLCLGPLSVDAALALPKSELRELQDEFLKWHDVKTHRLWFMWPLGTCDGSETLAWKCGCLGNCCFFGANRNGPKFFDPNEQDFSNSLSTAVYHICVDENNYGYGQSILLKNQLIFSRLPGPMFLSTPTRRFLIEREKTPEVQVPVQCDVLNDADMRSPPTQSSNTNPFVFAFGKNSQSNNKIADGSASEKRIEESRLTGGQVNRPVILELHKTLDGQTVPTDSLDATFIVKDLSQDAVDDATSPLQSLTSQGSSVPSELLPSSTIPDAYDTDRMLSTPSDSGLLHSGASASGSLPDLIDIRAYTSRRAAERGHSRQSSYEPGLGQAATQHGGVPIHVPSPVSGQTSPEYVRLRSPASLQGSQHSVLSQASSLTSPVLRRLSQREGSLISMESSATFMSAHESMSDDVSSGGGGLGGPGSRQSSFRSDRQRLQRGSLNSSLLEEAATYDEADEAATDEHDRLWFAMDRDNTITSAMDHQRTLREMGRIESRYEDAVDGSTSEASSSMSSFVSAVSSQNSDSKREPCLQESDVLLSDRPYIPLSRSAPDISMDEHFEKVVDKHDIPSAGDYVDLHGQMNQPITKSPLLMSCYTAHMTKLQCSYWSAPPPHPHGPSFKTTSKTNLQNQGQALRDPSRSWIPQFAYVKEGFTPSLMVNRKEAFAPEPPPLAQLNTAECKTDRFFADQDKTKVNSTMEIVDDVSKTTAIINLAGSVDVMVSPLMLEALQRYVESVTPVLGSLHPSTILNSLHFRCLNAIKNYNQLSAEPADLDTSHLAKRKESKDIVQPGGSAADSEKEGKASRIQVMFALSRINLCILQASLVEEMVPFSGLDRVQELTCVSVLACCLDDLHAEILLSDQSTKQAGAGLEGAVSSAEGYPAAFKHSSIPDAARRGGEVGEDHVPRETQREDMAGQLHIGCIHAQLRRLKKNSNFSDNVTLTAIPEYRSKVLFTFKQKEQQMIDRFAEAGATPGEEYSKQTDSQNVNLEEIAGFIMVEAGLENITLKVARRSGYEDIKEESKAVVKVESSAHMEPSVQTMKRERQPVDEPDSSEDHGSVRVTADYELSVRSQAGSMSSDSSAVYSVDDKASTTSSKQNTQKPSGSDLPPVGCSTSNTVPDDSASQFGKAAVQGDASSLALEFTKAWFNFAAPPSSKRKKLQFTRHDWNLASTATPAINAWMNPCHRAIVSAHNLVSRFERRVITVMACLMTEALDHRKLHNITRSRYSKLTALSRTLQDDPSCQLLTVLRQYVRHIGVASVESSVAGESVPQSLTLQKGILALTRSWKYFLRMPVDTTFKNKRKGTTFVTFQLPNDDSDHMDDDGHSFDEAVDDKASLLKTEGGSMRQTGSFHSLVTLARRSLTASLANLLDTGAGGGGPTAAAGTATEPGVGGGDVPLQTLKGGVVEPGESAVDGLQQKSYLQRKLRSVASASGLVAMDSPSKKPSHRSQSFVLPGEGGVSKRDVLSRNESHTSFHSLSGPTLSDGVDGGPSQPGTPLKQASLEPHLTELDRAKRKDENLYFWMQRQFVDYRLNMSYFSSLPSYEGGMGGSVGGVGAVSGGRLGAGPTGLSASRIGASELSQEDKLSIQKLMALHQTSFTVADAQTLFKPLLVSMGLKLGEVKTSALMKKLGCHLSVKIIMSSLRIDIVDSENSPKRNKGKGKGKRTFLPMFYINTNLDTPAFYCDRFKVRMGVKDIVNFESEKTSYTQEHESKFAFDSLIAKPTTTKANLILNIHSINQHVNMSLLRLLHQFVTMIENINDTRAELKGLTSTDAFKGHRKQDSKGSSSDTGAESVGTGQPEFPNFSRSDIEMPLPQYDEGRRAKNDTTSLPVLDSAVSPPPPQSRPDKLQLPAPGMHAKHLFAKSNMYELLSTKSTPEMYGEAEFPDSGFDKGIDIELGATADTSSPAVVSSEDKTMVQEIKQSTPQCWRNLYALVNLYATVPQPRTITKPATSRLSVIDEEPDKASQSRSFDVNSLSRLRRLRAGEDPLERQPLLEAETPITPSSVPSSSIYARAYPTATVFNQSVLMGERVPLVIFGVMCVKQVRMSAMLSGLKLEADLSNFNASATHRQKIKGVTKRRSEETSVTANVGHTMIALLEGVAPNMQTVVTVNVAQSQGLYSGLSRRGRLLNQCLLTVGLVDIDIPQHPGVLHGMVSRSSKRLSSTLQEFIRRPTKSKSAESATEAAATPSAQASRQSDVVDGARLTADPQKAGRRDEEDEEDTPKPLLINFKAVLKGLAVGASLLPSLRAQYQMGKVISSGLTGKKARFIVDLPTHSLSFSSKVSTPLNLPSFASVELPPIHMHAEYRVQPEASAPAPPRDYLADGLGEGLEFRPGNFLYAVAEVGLFQHCLATDLLNHLVFVQKVFMKEINEVVQKISGVDQPVSIWGEDVQQAPVRPLLYSLHFRLKGMEITATTPTSSAVRLETGVIDLDVSNRVQSARSEPTVSPTARHRLKPFVKLQLELKLALGSLLKNPIFVEADAEFQQLATFATRINMRNALQHEMIPGSSKDQEALMILLQRPVVSVMPTAFDKAVLVWLNYKNAYEYWTEQRLAQIQDMTPAGSSAWGKAGSTPIAESAIPESAESNPTQESSLTSRGSNVEGVQAAAAQALGTLFLQLTVDDLGICLPIGNTSQSLGGVGRVLEDAGTPALVLTLESTQISACSCGSLVSKGRFKGFCLRFASDFEVSWDDWKPDRSLDVVMNAMVVPCGTYEVCSRTKDATSKDPLSNAKWILNIKWEMEGMVIHLDTNIGKRLSALGDTLTTLGVGEPFNTETESAGGGGGGSEDEEDDVESSELEDFATANEAAAAVSRKISTIPEGLPAFMYDISLDTKTRARFIEQEMNEQAKTVEDLKQLGASQGTIEAEERKLIEFEKAVFDDFRQDLWKKLRKQGAKTAVIKDKLGLGYKPAHSRSRSIGNHPGVPRPEPASRGMTLFNEDKSTTLFDAAITESESDSSIGHQRALSLDVSAMAKGRSFDDVLPPLPHATQSDTDVRKQARRSELAELRNQQIMEDSASTSSDEETPVIQLSRSKRTVPDTTTHIPPPPPPSKAPPSSPTAPPTTTEPMVDFEVDIKVDISRGRCVVHPKEPKTEDEPKSSSKKEVIGGSPRSERKKAARKLDSSGRGFGQADNTTVFYLPGIDIKVHYESKLVPIEERTSPSSSMKRDVQPPSFADVTNLNSGTLVKKGNMYAWISLQQLSEEMMISPTLLDFLEQALEPIPVTQLLQPKTPASPGTAPETPMSSSTAVPPMDLDTIAASLGPANSAASTSFPVDVVVYIRVQPSLIRFTCLPVSRVQCLLRLPSFDVVFSTKKADVIGSQLGSQDPLNQSKRGESLKRPGSGATLHTSSTNVGGGGGLLQRSGIMASRARRLSGVEQDPSSGGLSVTACISDFSLNVFHPYGGSTARREPAFTKRPGTLRDSLGSPGSEPGRKDSLSLVVEFVKVNISRTRKGLVHSESMHKYFDTRAANIVRFSTLCDVGSASFNYDMRRLPEILALPKAWYRRTLARRLFLGEETAFMDSESGEDEFSLSSGSTPSDPLGSSLQRYSLLNETGKERARSPGTEERTGGAALADTKRNTLEDKYRKFKTPTDSVPQSPRLASPTGPPRSVQELLSGLSQTSPRRIIPMSALHSAPGDKQQAFSGFSRKQASQQWSGPAGGAAAQRAISEWETLVLFAVNLSQLHVTVNMSNVMGNTVWRTRDLKAQGQLLIDSSGYRNMHITAGLAGSKLEAKGGIVGGYIEIDRQEALLSIKEDPGRQPDHCVGLELCAIEIKLDYMGSSVLMNRFSGLRVQLNDEWLVDAGRDSQQPLATNRPAQIFVHGLLAWDKFHLMLSRSTTPDLLKMVNKLEEFFSQQLTSGKRALLAMGTLPLGRGHRRKNSAEESSWISEIRHHRHWQQVLERIAGCKFTNLTFVLPQQGTILGGSMNLHGNNITLACFHGINFRSKSWALFTMEEPLISFSTESQDLVDDAGERCTHIIQQLTFQLGDNMVARGAKRHMAYICKLSRGHYMPPPFTNVTDWFHYAFSTNEIKDLDSFPTMARMEHWSVSPGADADTTPSATAPLRSMSRGGAVGGKKGTEHADDTEVIFMLPLFQMHLNTLHLQGVTEPQEGDPQPVVECSFVTEFEDHIFVAMDVEVLLFLHDLVMSYVKERDKGSERKLSSPDVDKKNIANPTTVLKLDYRHFRCNTWILEPTIRLISWAGNRIEPVGVDYILQKLGFQHARLTVPKWMQRGCMDPLDKLLSILIDKLIVFLKQEEEEEGAEQSSTGNASANISVAAGPTALTTLSVPVRPRVTFS